MPLRCRRGCVCRCFRRLRCPRVFPILNPVFEIAGDRYVMLTQAIAPYDRDRLARWMVNLALHEGQIIKAIDHLMLGS